MAPLLVISALQALRIILCNFLVKVNLLITKIFLELDDLSNSNNSKHAHWKLDFPKLLVYEEGRFT